MAVADPHAGVSAETRVLPLEPVRACRRVEGFLAQVLQRRRNHDTFKVCCVAEEERPDLLERFKIETVPTLVVVENKPSPGGSSGRAAAARSRAFSRPGSTSDG